MTENDKFNIFSDQFVRTNYPQSLKRYEQYVRGYIPLNTQVDFLASPSITAFTSETYNDNATGDPTTQYAITKKGQALVLNQQVNSDTQIKSLIIKATGSVTVSIVLTDINGDTIREWYTQGEPRILSNPIAFVKKNVALTSGDNVIVDDDTIYDGSGPTTRFLKDISLGEITKLGPDLGYATLVVKVFVGSDTSDAALPITRVKLITAQAGATV
jgi:hypothetical protein